MPCITTLYGQKYLSRKAKSDKVSKVDGVSSIRLTGLWKRSVLSLKWKSTGVTDSDSSDGDNDELVSMKSNYENVA